MRGAIYSGVGRFPEALTLLEAARANLRRVLGPDHPQSLRAGVNLALALSRSGAADQAIAEFEQALEVADRVLVPQHRLTISARMGLASCYRRAGRPADGITVLEQAIRDFQPVSGPDAGQLRVMRAARAACLAEAGRDDEAIASLRDIVAEFDGFDQADDQTVRLAVAARTALAQLYRKAGRGVDADAMLRRALPDARRVYGPVHPTTRAVAEALGRKGRPWLGPTGWIRIVAAGLAVAALVTVSALLASRTPALRPAPAPGYESPANTVAGFTGGLFSRHPANACRYTAPNERDICGLGLAAVGIAIRVSGAWTIGNTVISGNRAIVDVEYRARATNGASLENTDPNAGLPHAGLSFPAAFELALRTSDYAIDCVRSGGRWYVDDVESPAS